MTVHRATSGLSFEITLRELAKDLRRKERLNLDDYYQLLEWADVWTLFLPDDPHLRRGVGFEIDGIQYTLIFMSGDVANDVADRCKDAVVSRVSARELLQRLPDGWGVIVDWDTDAELRIAPAQVTDLNEQFRIKPVVQEATHEWLAAQNATLAGDGVPPEARHAKVKAAWSALNGFQVLPGSRRERRIDHYFAVIADRSRADSRQACERRWRNEYAYAPYLNHLSDDNLRFRLGTIMSNLLFSDRGALPHELTELEWLELFHHIQFEIEGRGQAFLDVISHVDILAAWPNLDRARAAFAAYRGPRGHLFKFGQRQHLEPMVDSGAIRVFSAARYDDPSLTPAQRDDELARSVLIDATKLRIEHTDKNGVRRQIPAIGSMKYTMKSKTNYYVWCTTTTFDERLFDDFRTDACLVIHDAPRFTDRFLPAVQRILPTWVGAEQLVRYFDPLRAAGQVLSTYHKDFRYAYQREYRFAWDPPAPEIRSSLPPLDLVLGNLSDVAFLVPL